MWSNTYWHAQLLPREENGNPLLYSCLEDSMDTGVLEGLQFMGSKRVRCDWQTHTHKHTQLLSSVWVFVTPKTAAHQACLRSSPSPPWDCRSKNTGVGAISSSRESSWPRTEPESSALQADSLLLHQQSSPLRNKKSYIS